MTLKSIKRTPRSRDVNQPPRSRAFLLEMLLNMLIFTLCAVIALQVFVEGKSVTDRSEAITQLTAVAKDLAGHYKVTSGDVNELLRTIHGASGQLSQNGAVTYYYDSNLEPVSANDAHYRLVLTPVAGKSNRVKTIEIAGYAQNEELFTFEVTNYQPQRGR